MAFESDTDIVTRTVGTNGVDLRVVEAGQGFPVILAHGFPELAYSWRHQIPALAAAGHHVLAPDQRGYGGSSRPDAVEAYDITQLTNDLLGILDEIDEERAVFVGHDSSTSRSQASPTRTWPPTPLARCAGYWPPPARDRSIRRSSRTTGAASSNAFMSPPPCRRGSVPTNSTTTSPSSAAPASPVASTGTGTSIGIGC